VQHHAVQCSKRPFLLGATAVSPTGSAAPRGSMLKATVPCGCDRCFSLSVAHEIPGVFSQLGISSLLVLEWQVFPA